MSTPYSVASPNAAFQILAQFDAARERWVYRVFGPQAAWYGSFLSAEAAIAFVRDSTEPPDEAVAAGQA